MIKSFQDKDACSIFNGEHSSKFVSGVYRVARRKLIMIDAAVSVSDLRVPPGNHLEKLHGDRAGQYSIRINKKWRVCFNFKSNNAYNIEIIDYH